MELRHLRYFDAVARERSFSRAAERLGISQPPLSRQIRELEKEMGLLLFDRNSRPVKLTQAGRLFDEQAAQILSCTDQLKRSMQRSATYDMRRFVIGFVGSLIYGAFPDLVRHFRLAAPHADVQLIEMAEIEQIPALKEGRIDVGLGRIRVNDPTIRREILTDEPLTVAVPSGHPLATRDKAIRLVDLANDPLIVFPSQPRPGYADQMLRLLRDHGLRPKDIIEVRDVQTAVGMVAALSGITLLPVSVRHLQRNDVVYVPIADEDATSPVILTHRIGDIAAETRLFETLGLEVYRAPSEGL